jgi:hypothetical protein
MPIFIRWKKEYLSLWIKSRNDKTLYMSRREEQPPNTIHFKTIPFPDYPEGKSWEWELISSDDYKDDGNHVAWGHIEPMRLASWMRGKLPVPKQYAKEGDVVGKVFVHLRRKITDSEEIDATS